MRNKSRSALLTVVLTVLLMCLCLGTTLLVSPTFARADEEVEELVAELDEVTTEEELVEVDEGELEAGIEAEASEEGELELVDEELEAAEEELVEDSVLDEQPEEVDELTPAELASPQLAPSASGYVWPLKVKGTISAGWNYSNGSYHGATDIAGIAKGTDVIASKAGTVKYIQTGYSRQIGSTGMASYGNLIILYHPDSKTTRFDTHITKQILDTFSDYVDEFPLHGEIIPTKERSEISRETALPKRVLFDAWIEKREL